MCSFSSHPVSQKQPPYLEKKWDLSLKVSAPLDLDKNYRFEENCTTYACFTPRFPNPILFKITLKNSQEKRTSIKFDVVISKQKHQILFFVCTLSSAVSGSTEFRCWMSHHRLARGLLHFWTPKRLKSRTVRKTMATPMFCDDAGALIHGVIIDKRHGHHKFVHNSIQTYLQCNTKLMWKLFHSKNMHK